MTGESRRILEGGGSAIACEAGTALRSLSLFFSSSLLLFFSLSPHAGTVPSSHATVPLAT
jgi:hypothetical protein